MVPTLPFISCLAALAIVGKPVPNWLRRSGWVVAILISVINLAFIFSLGSESNSGLWPQLLGNGSRNDYLKNRHMQYPAPYYSAMEYINQSLPANAKVLFLGEPRTYYCERDSVSATVFDHNPFWIAARESHSVEDLFERVKKMGVTHILVSADQLYSNADRPTVMPKDIIAGKVFGDFWNRCVEKVFEDLQRSPDGSTKLWLIVYKLRDKPNDNLSISPINPLRLVLEWSALRKARS
jgi:hypothetical protein